MLSLATNFGVVAVAGLAVTADGNELDVALACGFNRAAGDQALAVGQQDNLEHDARVVGAGAYLIVLELGIERAELEFVIDHVVQREGKAARATSVRADATKLNNSSCGMPMLSTSA